jgi:lipoprotein-anchoring transpeptidase ErfK/SrfK
MVSAKVGICATVAVAAIAACSVAVEPAYADFGFFRQFRPFFGYHYPARPKYRPREKNPGLKEKAAVQEKPPLQIVVSIADQRISVYDGGALIAQSSVSTGVPDHPTPSGVFSIIGKHIWHRSNLYSDAPMPYMQRITWSGIALHAGDLPGYPASHGCIRLERDFAIRLWHLTRRGTRVIVAPNDVRPIEIASPHLPVSRPKDPLPKTAAVVADAAMTDATVLPAAADDQPQTTAEGLGSPVPEAARKPIPISIFVSRKSNKLYVRQAFKPLFEAPVTIEDSEEPLGTHVFSHIGARGEDADPQWTVVSIPEGPARVTHVFGKRQKSAVKAMAETVAPDSSTEKARAALKRIAMPPDVVERIADLLVPGSSLILSDQAMSKETGRGTDFIVETR